MAHQYTLPIRDSSSKPKGYMSGNTAQYTPEQVQGFTPNQAIPSNTTQAQPPIINLTHDQKAWDTILVCCLLSKLFGTSMSDADIANVINLGDERTDCPIGPETVTHMLKIAESPSERELHPETCGYEKWEGVRERLAARNGVRDGGDRDMAQALLIFLEALRNLNLIKLCVIGVAGRYSYS